MVEEGKRREKQGAVEEKGKRSGNLPLLPNPFASRLGSDQVIKPFLSTDYSSAQVFRVMTRVMDPLAAAAAAAVLLVVLVVLVVAFSSPSTSNRSTLLKKSYPILERSLLTSSATARSATEKISCRPTETF